MPAPPCWAAPRSLFARSCPPLPIRWAPMAAALTGVQRSQPAFATRPVAESEPASPAAAFSATAFASVPPNQADRPTSCSVRDRVLRAMEYSSEGWIVSAVPTLALRGHAGRGQPAPMPRLRCPDSRAPTQVPRLRCPDSGAVAQGGALAGLVRLDLAVLRRGGGDQGVEEAGGGGRDLGDGPVEGLRVDPRGLRRTTDLADVLERRGRDLVVGRRWLEVGERADVPAHGMQPKSAGYMPERPRAADAGGAVSGPGGPMR